MAINVNTVYQTVLSILNKEQRGFLTPAEFNKLGAQVQLDIFEKYFEDLNQQMRVPQNDSQYANRVKHIQEKIAFFETQVGVSNSIPSNCHRIGSIVYAPTNSNKRIPLEELSVSEFNYQTLSPLFRSSLNYPTFYLNGQTISVNPSDLIGSGELILNFIRKPNDVVWAYSVNPNNGAYIWSGSGSGQDFEIDNSDRTEVILKVLQYAGIVIRDPQIIQTAGAMAQAEDVNEKS